MPTTKAHGYQIGKTCEKLSILGNEVELIIPNRKNHVADDLFEYYGLERNFTVKKIDCPDIIFLSKYIGAMAFYTQSLFFSAKLLFLNLKQNSIIYSRDIIIIFIFLARGFNVVYNVHNWSKKRKLFSNLFLNKNFKIVCNSEGTKKDLTNNGFNNIIAVPNGVDLEEYSNLGDKYYLRKKFNLPINKKIIMYVGSFYKWKGIEVVLKSAKLLNNNKDIIFIVVGGNENDLEKYTKNKEIFKNVLFIGHKPRIEIPSYLKSADILLLPNTSVTNESVNYTSPIKMFEYMASGVPIIASNLPSMREVLNSNNSFLVEPDNSQLIISGIKKILNDKDFSDKLARRSLEDVKKYTWDEYAAKILNFIKK